ncbi:hypothetical protein C0991_008046, partial [Blastosporella zonata]
VVDPDSVPLSVQNERPGKKSNFYCVQFFPAGDYAWLVPKDISKLQPVEIEAYINEPFKKSGDLLLGYKTAQDPNAWEAKRKLAAAAASEEEDMSEEGGEQDDVDQLVSDGEKAKAGEKKSRKRKRESVEPPAKTRKTPKQREAAVKKEKEKKEPKKGRKTKTATGKAVVDAVVESEGEEDADGEGEVGEEAGASAGKELKEPESPPPAKKARRDEEADDATLQADPEAIKVREWRHRLQKAFLSNKSTPDDGDMPALDQLFSIVEAYQTMTVAYLQFSKIGKVMRHITLLDDMRIPRDAEFKFKDRAQTLVERWQAVLNAAKEGEVGGVSLSAKAPTGEKVKKEGGEKKDAEKGDEGKKDADGDADMEADEKENAVNGAKEVNGSAPPAAATNGHGDMVTEAAAKVDLNGTEAAAGTADAHGDAEMAAPTDADAPGEADGEADVSGQADAPGETEDVPMA